MASGNVIEEKSFEFALRIIKLYKYLTNEKKEYVLSKQLLRSGTSIGANVTEGLRGQSKRDFLAKMNISLKEANESEYWLRLLIKSKYLDEREKVILEECRELCKILNSIVKSTKQKLEN